MSDKKSKSSDFKMVTSLITKIPISAYLAENEEGYIRVNSYAKVVFSGLGADEVFGGYARYKTAFIRGGEKEMENEMSLDLDRLWHRNMGRDDRVISSTGKEARFPFLDPNLVRFMRDNCPSTVLCDWSDLRG